MISYGNSSRNLCGFSYSYCKMPLLMAGIAAIMKIRLCFVSFSIRIKNAMISITISSYPKILKRFSIEFIFIIQVKNDFLWRSPNRTYVSDSSQCYCSQARCINVPFAVLHRIHVIKVIIHKPFVFLILGTLRQQVR